jgi:hypothetical protein
MKLFFIFPWRYWCSPELVLKLLITVLLSSFILKDTLLSILDHFIWLYFLISSIKLSFNFKVVRFAVCICSEAHSRDVNRRHGYFPQIISCILSFYWIMCDSNRAIFWVWHSLPEVFGWCGLTAPNFTKV